MVTETDLLKHLYAMNEAPPLYNSRVFKTYLDYLKTYHPDQDLTDLLEKAQIQEHEINDPAHWFSQQQADQFHQVLLATTQNPTISRDAGQFSVFSKNLGTFRQYAMGLLNPMAVLLLVGKIYPLLSRGASAKTQKLDHNKIEIIVTPSPAAEEKPYQCQNRLGYFEAMVKLFFDSKVTIEHPDCYHRGDKDCRYIVSWETPRSFYWKRLKNYAYLFSFLTASISFFTLPQIWLPLTLGCFLTTLGLSNLAYRIEAKELNAVVLKQSQSAFNQLELTNRKSTLIHVYEQVGQTSTTEKNPASLAQTTLALLNEYLDYGRGLFLMADVKHQQLQVQAGYGYSKEDFDRLTQLKLDLKETTHCFVEVFTHKTPTLINGLASTPQINQECETLFCSRSPVFSAAILPVAYEEETFGLLAVCYPDSAHPILQSDLDFLKGVASQAAIGISNANAYQSLKESEQKYRTLIETTGTGYAIANRQGIVMEANDEYVRLSGQRFKNDVTGHSILNWVAEKDHQRSRDAFNKCFVTGSLKHFEVQYISPKGKITPVEINASVVEMKGETYILGICRDLTEQKQAQEMILQTEKMSTVGGLAAGMAHELNNPLAGILQTLQVLQKRLSDGQSKYETVAAHCGTTLKGVRQYHEKLGTFEKIDSILKAGKRAADIVNNLISFSHKDESYFKRHDISMLLDRAVDMARSDYDLKTNYDFREITITRRYDPDVPLIPCAASKIQQVFLNILKNGAHVMCARDQVANNPEFVLEIQNRDNMVWISIADNGPGVDEETRKRLLDPFYTTKPVGDGKGLGLSISYFIIRENHGGDLQFQSIPGKGSKVIITLPIRLGP